MGDATRDFVSQWTRQGGRVDRCEDPEVQWRSVQRVTTRCQPTLIDGDDDVESAFSNAAAPQWLGWACSVDMSTGRHIETLAASVLDECIRGHEYQERLAASNFIANHRARPQSASASRSRVSSHAAAVNLDPAKNRSRPQSAKQPRPSSSALLSSEAPPQIKDSKWTEMMARSPDFQQKNLLRLEIETYELLQRVFHKECRVVASSNPGLKKHKTKLKHKNKQNAVALKTTKASEAKQRPKKSQEEYGNTVKSLPCGSGMHLARDRKQNGSSHTIPHEHIISSLNQTEPGDHIQRMSSTPRQLARRATKSKSPKTGKRSAGETTNDGRSANKVRNDEDAVPVRDRVLVEMGWATGHDAEQAVDSTISTKQIRGRLKHDKPKKKPKHSPVVLRGDSKQSSAPAQSNLDANPPLESYLNLQHEPGEASPAPANDADQQLEPSESLDRTTEDELSLLRIEIPKARSDRSLHPRPVGAVDKELTGGTPVRAPYLERTDENAQGREENRSALLHEEEMDRQQLLRDLDASPAARNPCLQQSLDQYCGSPRGDEADAACISLPDCPQHDDRGDEGSCITSDLQDDADHSDVPSSQLTVDQQREQLVEFSRCTTEELRQEETSDSDAAKSPSTPPEPDLSVMECDLESERATPNAGSFIYDTIVLDCEPSAPLSVICGDCDSLVEQQVGGDEWLSDEKLNLELTDAEYQQLTGEIIAEFKNEGHEDQDNVDHETLMAIDLPVAEVACDFEPHPERPTGDDVYRDPEDPDDDAIGEQEHAANGFTEPKLVGNNVVDSPKVAEERLQAEELGERALLQYSAPNPPVSGGKADDEAGVADDPAPLLAAKASLESEASSQSQQDTETIDALLKSRSLSVKGHESQSEAQCAAAVVVHEAWSTPGTQDGDDPRVIVLKAEHMVICELKEATRGPGICNCEDLPQAVSDDVASMALVVLPNEQVDVRYHHTQANGNCEREGGDSAVLSAVGSDNASDSEPVSSLRETKSPRGMLVESFYCGGQAAASSVGDEAKEEEVPSTDASSVAAVIDATPVASSPSLDTQVAPVLEDDQEVWSLVMGCRDVSPASCSEMGTNEETINELTDRKGEELGGGDSKGALTLQRSATTPPSPTTDASTGSSSTSESAEGSSSGDAGQTVCKDFGASMLGSGIRLETVEARRPHDEPGTANPRNEDKAEWIDGIPTRKAVETGGEPEMQVTLDTDSAVRRIQQQYRCFVQRQILADQLKFLVSQHHRQARKKTRRVSTDVATTSSSLSESRAISLSSESPIASLGIETSSHIPFDLAENAVSPLFTAVDGTPELGHQREEGTDEQVSYELSIAVEHHTVEPPDQFPEPHHLIDDEAEIIATETCGVEVYSATAIDAAVSETTRVSKEADSSYSVLATLHEYTRAHEEHPVEGSTGDGEETSLQPGWPAEPFSDEFFSASFGAESDGVGDTLAPPPFISSADVLMATRTPEENGAELFGNGDLSGEVEPVWSFPIEPLLASEDPGSCSDNDAKLRTRAASIALAALAFDDTDTKDPGPQSSQETAPSSTDHIVSEPTSSFSHETAVIEEPSGAGHWERYLDAATSKLYYFNPSTQVSQWTLPVPQAVDDSTAPSDNSIMWPAIQTEVQVQEAWHQARSQALLLESSGGWDKLLMMESSAVFFYHGGRDEYFIGEEGSTTPGEFSKAQSLCELYQSPAVPEGSYVEAHGDESDRGDRWSLRRNGSQSAEIRGDWQAFVDTESHQRFYYNARTGESSWDKPAVFQASTDAAMWVAYMDDASGAVYYVNHVTGETSWDKPEDRAQEGEASREDGEEDEYVIRIDERV